MLHLSFIHTALARVTGRTGLLLLLLPFLWLASTSSAAAQAPAADSLDRIGNQLRRHEQRDPHEKLFLHLDRPVYLSGETMWFSVYAADGTTARPLPLSSVAYVEVINTRNQPVLQGKVALREATGQGSFVLPASLPAGRYTVRGYTSWMRNFSPDTYFHTAVTVINTFTASGTAAKDSATAEVQFFPEGGNLVRGLRSRVAFKVTDKSGRGVVATGKVLNQRGTVVATFQTLHRGMGSFAFTPAPGTDSYTAVMLLPNGQPLTRPLPRAFDEGYVLHLEQPDPAHLTLTVTARPARTETVYLLGHSRQQVALASRLPLVNGQGTLSVDAKTLLDGVSHFTLFSGAQQPVCERLFFRAPARTLAIAARPDKPQYGAREKVLVQVSAADQQIPLAASLSMAVYRLDSLNTTSQSGIDRSLWLTSELAGAVEDPDYYFTASGPTALEATDNLLLTQGWSRFRWEDVLAVRPTAMEFRPEPHGLVARAQLVQPNGVPRANVTAYLASPSRLTRLNNAQSDAQGTVEFELTDFSGPRDLVLQTDPAQDSTSRLTLLDPFSPRYASATSLAGGVLPRFGPDYARRHLQAQVQQAFTGKYRSRFVIEPVDSVPFFGQPSETYLLDKYTRFKTMEEVLREYVPGVVVRIRKDGFHLLVVDKVNKTVLDNNPLVLLDGVPVFNMNKIMAMNPLKIRKLEVVDSRYFHGSAMYDGIVNLTTYKNDLEGFELDPRVLVQQYEGVQRQREFYAPRYDTPQAIQSRLPDLRNLLYWNPAIRTTAAGPAPLEFYTGDQAGRYLVVVQGLANNGLAGSHRFVLEVKPAL